MRRHRCVLRVLPLFAWLPLLAILSLSRATPVTAQTGGDYTLTWTSIDGGGATTVEGGNYALGGTIGQPDAGRAAGGDFVLHGGFWPGGSAISIELQRVSALGPARRLIEGHRRGLSWLGQ